MGDRSIHKNPSAELLKRLLAKSEYGQVKGVVCDTDGTIWIVVADDWIHYQIASHVGVEYYSTFVISDRSHDDKADCYLDAAYLYHKLKFIHKLTVHVSGVGIVPPKKEEVDASSNR